MRRFWILIAIAGIAIVAMSAYQYLTRPSAGDPAPAFSLEALDGSTVSLADYRGRPVLLHFFATWCGVCMKELPALAKFAREAGSSGPAVVVISEDGEEGDALLRALFGKESPPFPVLLDRVGGIADLYQSFGVPETFLIDPEGTIAWRKAGPIDWAGGEVGEKMRSLVR